MREIQPGHRLPNNLTRDKTEIVFSACHPPTALGALIYSTLNQVVLIRGQRFSSSESNIFVLIDCLF